MHEQSCVQCYHINVHLTVVSVEGFPHHSEGSL